MKQLIECVPNFSEGRDMGVIKQITDEKHISIGEWVRDAIETALSTIQPKEETMK